MNELGYRYLKQKNFNPDQVVKYEFRSGDSCGRFVSRMVKDILKIERDLKNQIKAYVIENPGVLTFSAPLRVLIQKYSLKYSAGSPTKGPYYQKSVFGLFKLIIRTMMKYKGKHRDAFKKICVFINPVKLENVQSKFIETKDTTLSRRVSLNDFFKLI